MNDAYLDGFMKEAAAAGVDPAVFVKAAINFGGLARGAGRLAGRALGEGGVSRVSGAVDALRGLAGGAAAKVRPAASRYLELLGGGNRRISQEAGRAAAESARLSSVRQALLGRNANLGEQIGNLDRVIRGYGRGIEDAAAQGAKATRIAGRAADDAARAHEQYQFLLSRGTQLGTQADGLKNRGLIQALRNLLPGSQARTVGRQKGIADAAAQRAKGLFDVNSQRVESLNAAAQRATERRTRLQELFGQANANRERLAAEQMRVQNELPQAIEQARAGARAAERAAAAQRTEGRKVLAARGGTAAAGGLGTAALLSGDEKKTAENNALTNIVTEVASHAASPTLLGILGGLVTRHPAGVIAGTTAGGVGHVAGAIKALIDARRTSAEQAAYDQTTHAVRNLFLPGSGSYNMWKRLGRAIGDMQERK